MPDALLASERITKGSVEKKVTEESWLMLMFIAYKIVCLIVGILFSYMGYRLFMADKNGPAGDLDVRATAKGKKGSMLLRKAAPGTFFALFGTILIVFTILRGVEYQVSGYNPTSNQPVENFLPIDPPF